MREIHIDLSSDYYLQQPKVFGGYVGEHNESKLVVKLPNRMIRDDISYYYFEFQTVLGEHITSPNVYKNTLSADNAISIVLWEQLSPAAGNLKFCVNAIELGENGTVTIKGKTPVCTLYISESPTGEDVLIDTKSSKEELQKSIDSALKEAKDSGEFKGEKGEKGDPGYTPVLGVDYVTIDQSTEYVFDGGNSDQSVPTVIMVDDTLSETSDNAIANKTVAQAINLMWSKIYPIGSIYISAVSTSPSTLFGGSWERIKDTFLLAAGDKYSAGAKGGEATHTLTVSEMPSHYHNSQGWARLSGGSNGNQALLADGIDTNLHTLSTGGGQAHNNMPPYLAVYVWKRTA